MKIIEHTGNILDVKSGVIIHGCNAQGVMGSGVAKAIRNKYPLAYEVYHRHYSLWGLELGDIIDVHFSANNLTIINGITQKFYGREAKQWVNYQAVSDVFTKTFKLKNDSNVHFPLIGCGLGGGSWDIVNDVILSAAESTGFSGGLNLWRLPN